MHCYHLLWGDVWVTFQSFRTWIIESLSIILPVDLTSRFKIHLSGSFSIDSNLLLWNSLFAYEAGILTYEPVPSNCSVPLQKICTLLILHWSESHAKCWSIKLKLYVQNHSSHLILWPFSFRAFSYSFWVGILSMLDVDPPFTNNFLHT